MMRHVRHVRQFAKRDFFSTSTRRITEVLYFIVPHTIGFSRKLKGFLLTPTEGFCTIFSIATAQNEEDTQIGFEGSSFLLLGLLGKVGAVRPSAQEEPRVPNAS